MAYHPPEKKFRQCILEPSPMHAKPDGDDCEFCQEWRRARVSVGDLCRVKMDTNYFSSKAILLDADAKSSMKCTRVDLGTNTLAIVLDTFDEHVPYFWKVRDTVVIFTAEHGRVVFPRHNLLRS